MGERSYEPQQNVTGMDAGVRTSGAPYRDLLASRCDQFGASALLNGVRRIANEMADAAQCIRSDGNRIVELEQQRDALAAQVVSFRKALEFVRTCEHLPIWVFKAQHWGLHERPDGHMQPFEVFCMLLAAAAGVPAEHLAGPGGSGTEDGVVPASETPGSSPVETGAYGACGREAPGGAHGDGGHQRLGDTPLVDKLHDLADAPEGLSFPRYGETWAVVLEQAGLITRAPGAGANGYTLDRITDAGRELVAFAMGDSGVGMDDGVAGACGAGDDHGLTPVATVVAPPAGAHGDGHGADGPRPERSGSPVFTKGDGDDVDGEGDGR